MKSQSCKTVAALLILSVFASCFFLIKTSNASSTPEFSLQAIPPNKINITITNREYASTVNGITVKPYFQIRQKAHSSDTWPEIDFPDNPEALTTQTTDSKYTVTEIATYYYKNNTQVDVQVRTILAGYITRHPQSGSGFIQDYSEFETELTLPWTDPQTISVYSISQATPITTYSPLPTAPPQTLDWQQTAIIVLAVLVVASWVAIIVLWRKKPHN